MLYYNRIVKTAEYFLQKIHLTLLHRERQRQMFRMINNMAYVYFNNKNRSSRFLQCKKKIRTTDTWQTFLQAVLVCNTRLAAILILNVVEAKVHCNWIGNIRQFLHEAFIYYKNDILRFVEYHIAKINSQVTK